MTRTKPIKAKPTRTTQTVRLNGARVKITTANGKVTTKPAPPLEWELQAAQVKALRALPEYQHRFLLAGDQNAARRGPRAQQQAVATGMTAGEPDLRIYGENGRLLMIENKVGKGRLSTAQVDRHAALKRMGYEVHTVSANSHEEAANVAVSLVLMWLVEGQVKWAA